MPATLAMPTSVPLPRSRIARRKVEGGRHADHVGLEGGAHNLEILEHLGVDADADAGIGDHHVGHAPGRRCRRGPPPPSRRRRARRQRRRWRPRPMQPWASAQVRSSASRRATSASRQPALARRQRLADAARRTGDEDELACVLMRRASRCGAAHAVRRWRAGPFSSTTCARLSYSMPSARSSAPPLAHPHRQVRGAPARRRERACRKRCRNSSTS